MHRFKAIDLFCGAGGLSSGLKKSGFDIKVSVDIDEQALSTYRNNFKRTKVIQSDIKNISAEYIGNLAGLKCGENFLLAGCPPCQGFSNIGKRDKNDLKNELVYEYIRIVNDLRPSFILMENVPGMSKGIGKKIFNNVIQQLSRNYYIEYDTLNAANYGVPQVRKRLVVHGIRRDVYERLIEIEKVEKLHILPSITHSKIEKKGYRKWKTVGDSIMDLPELNAGDECKIAGINNHVTRKISAKNTERLKEIRENGGTRTCLPDELSLKCHKKENVSYTDTYGVMNLDKPAPTITSGCTTISKGRFGHPTQNRGISVREAARLQSFDDNFIFSGNLGSMSLQIGNAVPPKLAAASAKVIFNYMNIYQENI